MRNNRTACTILIFNVLIQAPNTFNGISKELSSACKECLTQILMEEIKPEITEKYDCEDQDKSMRRAPSILGFVRFYCKKLTVGFFIRKFLSECECFD